MDKHHEPRDPNRGDEVTAPSPPGTSGDSDGDAEAQSAAAGELEGYPDDADYEPL